MGILDQFKLDGQIALVSGCKRGIGKAMAIALAEAGADIAGPVVFLASAASDYLHGAVVLVDGGWMGR